MVRPQNLGTNSRLENSIEDALAIVNNVKNVGQHSFS
jgi:hypothetical protein